MMTMTWLSLWHRIVNDEVSSDPILRETRHDNVRQSDELRIKEVGFYLEQFLDHFFFWIWTVKDERVFIFIE